MRDVLADNNGAYRQYGNVSKFYEIKIENGSLEFRNIQPKDIKNDDLNIYQVTKTFYRSMIQNTFRRKTFRIRRKKDSSFDKLIVCYINPGDQMFELKCHGNARKISRPYVKKTETCLNNIKSSAIKAESLTLAYAHLISEASKSQYQCEIPSSIEQLYKHKSLIELNKNKNLRTNDEYADALINRKKSNHY